MNETDTVESNAMKFRKKPVVIEAMQLREPNTPVAVATWCRGRIAEVGPMGHPTGVLIDTLEGTMRADTGDWIIRGVQGEFYPCKPDIFEATYEARQQPAKSDADRAESLLADRGACGARVVIEMAGGGTFPGRVCWFDGPGGTLVNVFHQADDAPDPECGDSLRCYQTFGDGPEVVRVVDVLTGQQYGGVYR
jgi:hypothetical protein